MQLLNNSFVFWITLIVANILMYGLTILISFLWSKFNSINALELSAKDISVSIQVLIANILVAIPGYLLFRKGFISFTTDDYFFLHLLLLYFVFDFTMYILHYTSHHLWPFKRLHFTHHTHRHFNAISLYVMDPLESIFFGLLLTISAYFLSLNLYSFLVFIFINWILGLVGHLNTKSTKQPRFLGNHIFHKTHHQYPNRNYGFYTLIWDTLFGTIYQEKE